MTRWPARISDGTWGDRVSLRRPDLEATWRAFIGGVPWDSAVTLTFDAKRRFPVKQEKANREAFRWCGLAAFSLSRPLGWAYSTERSPNGMWHAHVLIAGATVRALETAARVWEERNGRIHVQVVHDPFGAVAYLVKDASATGEVVLSDTLSRYRGHLNQVEASGCVGGLADASPPTLRRA